MINFIKKYQNQFLPIGLGLEALVFLISYLEAGNNLPAFFSATARISGRVSLLYFAIFLIYATINKSVEENSDALKTKIILAKNFAILHVIHWFLLITAMKLNGNPINIFRLVPGTMAYLMVIALPFILNRRIFKDLKLDLVQNVYIYYVWLIFFMTYLARISGNAHFATGTMSSYIFFMLVTIGLLIWRLSVVFLKKNNLEKV